jgi:PAS domain S-box-containing protein
LVSDSLRESPADWSAAFDAVNDSICLLDLDGTVLRCNRGMRGLLRLQDADIVGKKCYELMHDSARFFEGCPYREMLRTGERESLEIFLDEHWYQVTADPLRDEAGEIVGAVHIVRDTTDRRHAEDERAQRSRWLAAISDLAVDLAALPASADLGPFLGERLRELTDAAAVSFSEYEPKDRVLATRAIVFQPGAVKTLTAPLVKLLQGTRSPVSDDSYRQIVANANATLATLTEASFGAIPPAVDVTARKLLGVDRFVGLSYVIEGALYGTSVIALRAGTPDPPREELDAFGNLAAVSLRRRRAEVELAHQTEQVDRLFVLSGDILGIADMEGRIKRVNPAWQATLGYSLEETEGHLATDFVHPDEVDAANAAIAGLAEGRPLIEMTNRLRHWDGSYKLIEWRATTFEDRLVFLVGRDATARAEAQAREQARRQAASEELSRVSAYHRSLLEASLDPLVTIGPEGLITDVNEATMMATGRGREELVGTDFAEYFTDPAQARASYQQVFRVGAVRDYPLQIKHRDGSLTEVLYNASTYRDQDGEVVGVFAAARDVGELRRAEAEVLALNAGLERRVAERTRELDAANRQLQEFVYSVAHDLRTPLRAVDGFSLAVLEAYGDVIAEQGRSDLERVRGAAQSMGHLIDALLSLSRVGRHEVDLQPVDLSTVARRVVAELRESEPGRAVEVLIEDGMVAVSDAALLGIVLENLLGNAWKFTADNPEARVEFAAVDIGGRRAFRVRDNGAGFDPAYAHKLFSPFERLHTAEQFPGTGIGLATVAHALERLGGSWWAEGEKGAGAAFYFTLGARSGYEDPGDQ